MKWPAEIIFIRHGESAYNALKKKKESHPVYKEFRCAFEENPKGILTMGLAEKALEIFALPDGDNGTPLTDRGRCQARSTGAGMAAVFEKPDVIFVSPHVRTRDTLCGLVEGWPALAGAKTYEEVRIREQEHGVSLLYNDKYLFQAFHPEQVRLQAMEGRYWYRYPQGENVPDVQLRIGAWINTLIREFTGRRVLVVTHHLCILAIRATIERFGADEFLELDEKEKPLNCGVTVYRESPKKGRDGKLELVSYNKKYY